MGNAYDVINHPQSQHQMLPSWAGGRIFRGFLRRKMVPFRILTPHHLSGNVGSFDGAPEIKIRDKLRALLSF